MMFHIRKKRKKTHTALIDKYKTHISYKFDFNNSDTIVNEI